LFATGDDKIRFAVLAILSIASHERKRNMRVTLIHNPKAGANEQPSVDEFLTLIRAAGHNVTCQSPKGDEWENALVDPGDLVAVAGGDGTVGAVAVRLAGRRIPIAVLPVGTANNISKVLGLAETTPERLIAGWANARRIGFDTGVVHGPWEPTRFLEGLGVGLLARAITELDAKADVAFGRVDNREEKMTAGLKRLSDLVGNCPANELKITLDGQDLSDEYILLEVMNIQHIGPSLHFAPDADPGDGLLDVVLFTARQRDKLGEYLASCLEGNPHPLEWTVHKGKHLQLQCEESDMHIDDRVLPAHGSTASQSPMVLDVRVDRHALEFLV
jgi:diacylglycerol kinase (ATP)